MLVLPCTWTIPACIDMRLFSSPSLKVMVLLASFRAIIRPVSVLQTLLVDCGISPSSFRGIWAVPHQQPLHIGDRKSTRLNSSHLGISYAVFCFKKINSLSCEDKERPLARTNSHLLPLTSGA